MEGGRPTPGPEVLSLFRTAVIEEVHGFDLRDSGSESFLAPSFWLICSALHGQDPGGCCTVLSIAHAVPLAPGPSQRQPPL